MSRLRVIIREEIEKFVSEKSPAPASSKTPAAIDDDSSKKDQSNKK